MISEPESFDCTSRWLSGPSLSIAPPGGEGEDTGWLVPFILLAAVVRGSITLILLSGQAPPSSCRYFIFTVLFNDHGPRPIADGNTSAGFMYRARKIASPASLSRRYEVNRVSLLHPTPSHGNFALDTRDAVARFNIRNFCSNFCRTVVEFSFFLFFFWTR